MSDRRERADRGTPDEGESGGEAFSGAVEKGWELAQGWGEKDGEEAHCATCHHAAQQSERYSKAATIFSAGAFLLSVAAVMVPFLRPADEGFDAERLQMVLSAIEERLAAPASAPSSLPPAPVSSARVVPRRSSSARSLPASSSVAAPASSARAEPSSAAPASVPGDASGAVDPEPSATGGRPAP